jgi:hypothetical protein
MADPVVLAVVSVDRCVQVSVGRGPVVHVEVAARASLHEHGVDADVGTPVEGARGVIEARDGDLESALGEGPAGGRVDLELVGRLRERLACRVLRHEGRLDVQRRGGGTRRIGRAVGPSGICGDHPQALADDQREGDDQCHAPEPRAALPLLTPIPMHSPHVPSCHCRWDWPTSCNAGCLPIAVFTRLPHPSSV